MPLSKLQIRNFRNIESSDLEISQPLQIIHGDNASGKTSLLEAVSYTCSARSFLGVKPRALLKKHADTFLLIGHFQQPQHPPITLQSSWNGTNLLLKSGHQLVHTLSDYVSYQPVQAITPSTHQFFDHPPEIRRRFINWGLFHVKHDFHLAWKNFNKSLHQRNQLLKNATATRTMSAWNHEFIQYAEQLDSHRRQYVTELLPHVDRIMATLMPESRLTADYNSGWNREKGLGALLQESLDSDLDRRFTYYGPQRADLILRLDDMTSRDSLSRGQKKVLTFAMYLAQAVHLQQATGKTNLLLIDDLPSELDATYVSRVLRILSGLQMQTMITCIDPAAVLDHIEIPKDLFHVKQGEVRKVV